jgi:flagellar motor switch protein FliM
MATREEGADPLISDQEVQALLDHPAGANAPAAGEARPYDLAGTQRITRGRLPTLELLQETFARQFRLNLYALLKRDVQVTFEGVHSVKAGDYLGGQPLPACLDIVRALPLPGHVMFALDPALVFLMVDTIFGGPGRAQQRDADKGLTPTEVRFAQLVLKQACADLTAAWQPVLQLDFEFVKHEHNPHFINIAAPTDTLLVNRFRLDLHAGSGTFDFVLPAASVDPVREQLAAGVASRPPTGGEPWARLLAVGLEQADLEVRAVLAQAEISLRDLVTLKPGDVVPIEAPREATLLAGDVPLYTGRLGVSRGRNALKLQGPVRARGRG